jgi:hypothetical protein
MHTFQGQQMEQDGFHQEKNHMINNVSNNEKAKYKNETLVSESVICLSAFLYELIINTKRYHTQHEYMDASTQSIVIQ